MSSLGIPAKATREAQLPMEKSSSQDIWQLQALQDPKPHDSERAKCNTDINTELSILGIGQANLACSAKEKGW